MWIAVIALIIVCAIQEQEIRLIRRDMQYIAQSELKSLDAVVKAITEIEKRLDNN